MARVQHPTAGTVVTLEGDLLERYLAAGWVDLSAQQEPVPLEKPVIKQVRRTSTR